MGIAERVAAAVSAALVVAGVATAGAVSAAGESASSGGTTTPIQHVVVIFQENRSFDHYFGTYPTAANPPNEPAFAASPATPPVNGLTPELLLHNPNAANPKRLDRSQAVTCDMNHDYRPEQKAFDGGKMDSFVENTTGKNCGGVTTMDYYDGNTVTALWTYAQHFAMSDNFFDTTFGPSTPGVLNLVSGQTHGATPGHLQDPQTKEDVVANGSDIGDADPAYDDCSAGPTFAMSGRNVGDLLNAKGVTWGWFQGGFRPTGTDPGGKAICKAATTNVAGASITDYSAHHEPFQYYQSTANPHHLPPSSVAMIGQTDQANHQYDLSDFWAAADAGNLPAVSYLKAVRAQDGHPGYSDPLDEQRFLVSTINRLEALPTWASTAIFITYDDSDGWYDHVAPPRITASGDATNDFECGTPPAGAYPDRCGFGPRLPLLVISPYAKANAVDHSLNDFTSILRFIEDNWQLGRIGDQSLDSLPYSLLPLFDFASGGSTGALALDPSTGEPAASSAQGAPGPADLRASQAGTLAGNTGGSFAYYRVATPTGTPMTLTLSVGAFDGGSAHRIGLNVYQAGARIGGLTAQSTGLGDPVTDTSPSATVTPSATGGPVTIQVFNYSPSPVAYTLTRS